MAESSIQQIINILYDLDFLANKIYEKTSKKYNDPDLRSFWEKLAFDEEYHTKFWSNLSLAAKDNLIPDLFDDTMPIIQNLDKVRKRTLLFEADLDAPADIEKELLAAYQLEFNMMSTPMEKLFHFGKEIETINNIKSPEDGYAEHLERFIDGMNRFGKINLEMELLGDTLRKLWDENRKLVLNENTDYLTGLFNRRGFYQLAIPLSFFSQRSDLYTALIMIDIDDFKEINDSFGHDAGDRVLKGISTVLKKSVRSSDIAARYGGEEFVIFLTNFKPEEINNICEKIRTSVEKLNPENINVTISLGCVFGKVGRDIGKCLTDFIKKSDSLLYKAKESGKNKYLIEELL